MRYNTHYPIIGIMIIILYGALSASLSDCMCGRKSNFDLQGLNLQAFMTEEAIQDEGPAVYDLYALANHFGSMALGHYTASCKAPVNPNADESWHTFNDHITVPIATGNLQSSNAYMLFYSKRTLKS